MRNELVNKLTVLIERLGLPMTPEEAAEKAGNLSEDELKTLIDQYQKVLDYQNEVENLAAETDPEAYRQVTEKYEKSLEAVEEKYINDLESAREQVDQELDMFDQERSRIIKKSAEEADKEAKEIVDEDKKIVDKLKSSLRGE